MVSTTVTMKNHHHLPELFQRNDSPSLCSIRSTNCLPEPKQRSWSNCLPDSNQGSWSILDDLAPSYNPLRFEDVFRVEFRPPCTPSDPPCDVESALEEVWSHSRRKKKIVKFAQAVCCVTNLTKLASAERPTTTADTTKFAQAIRCVADLNKLAASERTNLTADTTGKKPLKIDENTSNLRRTASFTTYRHPLCDPDHILNIATSKTYTASTGNNDKKSHEQNDVQNSETITDIPELPPLREEKGVVDTKGKDRGGKGLREEKQCGDSPVSDEPRVSPRYVIDDPRGFIEEAILKRRGYCPTNPKLGTKLRRSRLLKTQSCPSIVLTQR